MSEFSVQVEITGDVGMLRWQEQRVDSETLEAAVSMAADDAIIAHELRRLQVDLPANDVVARRALQRCGFRLEGRLRSAQRVGNDDLVDVLIYARLAIDPVYGPQGFSGVMDSVLPMKRMIGHAVFRDSRGRVLLTETRYKEDWELPGGIVEAGESPRVGAEREVMEEIGLAVTFGNAALIDWMPPYLGWSDAIEFIFDGGTMTDDVAAGITVTDPRELAAVHWVAPEDLDEHVTELSARRIRLLLSGWTGMTEDGRPL
ncbi:NUDIX hydrolase [Tessaracoccus antarcticus]|uniref:NUDIX domain-containing protein n=1 Tax=Tessaracoccus antarcticus TaxID=2479848 RepID=A0A3M0G3C7_9ACTN|nr:NUDIX hydrolase [Tessaracoccus antarcticus]RMB59028.1 NUDIX domain-containing protein [Tessaracoccus antarcticus]